MDPVEVARQGPFFLEIFAGEGGITRHLRALHVPVLPPVDVVQSGEVAQARDVLDAQFWDRILALARAGAIMFVHLGTPCSSFSIARELPEGPPPVRSSDVPMGFPDLPPHLQAVRDLGNLLLGRSIEIAEIVLAAGGDFSLENPLSSILWVTPVVLSLRQRHRLFDVDVDQCAFGARSRKPTRFLVSSQICTQWARACPGGHGHLRLRGAVRDVQGRVCFVTKAAQVYPEALCATIAGTIQEILSGDCPWFQATYALKDDAPRKRPLGDVRLWRGHRQAEGARLAQFAGYQLKRGAVKPLLDTEVEPGVAMQWTMKILHPFTVPTELPEPLPVIIKVMAQFPRQLASRRELKLAWWGKRALELMPASLQRIAAVSDRALRRLLRGVPENHLPQLGQFCHICLFEELLKAAGSADHELPRFLLYGFPIVGPISRSNRWPKYVKPQAVRPISEALDRAWDLRRMVVNRVGGVPVSDALRKIWEGTLDDVADGSCVGPFDSEDAVSRFVGADDWIPTQRFEVIQKDKVRGCDSATSNMINKITEITEKLQLPSTDLNVAALKELKMALGDRALSGWVLDEKKAYRQVPIAPTHRKFSVIAMKDPADGRPKFFVMIGHSFGLVSAVYNYNRRSAAINEILTKVFEILAFNFYDDKYGFDEVDRVDEAHRIAIAVHWWLGARFDSKKLQCSSSPTILGVTYNLKDMILEIKDDRKQELAAAIEEILEKGSLDPGSAGKLKGKLMFGSSQLWGKIGRAFFRPISERQYMKDRADDRMLLNSALRRSLTQWKFLIEHGPPRPIPLRAPKKCDVVIFTDGFTPDMRKSERGPDRVGAVMLDRRLLHPVQFTETIPKRVSRAWIPRTTQIVPIEMIAPVLALETFKESVRDRDVLLLIDSEPVEAALVKGYSAKEDLSSLIEVFWNLALELRANIFIDRISSDSNPADWPSRDLMSLGEAVGWITVNCSWPGRLADSN